MNVSPTESQQTNVRPQPSGRGQHAWDNSRGGSYAVGRGNYNKNYQSPGGFLIFGNQCRETQASASTNINEH
jgi:hypothetical protein